MGLSQSDSEQQPDNREMPDSIVPIVRRPVRRLSTTSDRAGTSSKVDELNTATRKLSIGGETNERSSPPRLTRTSFLPSRSPTEERRKALISGEKSHTVSPEPEPAQSQDLHNCFPAAKKDNLRALPVARNRPIKTSVSDDDVDDNDNDNDDDDDDGAI